MGAFKIGVDLKSTFGQKKQAAKEQDQVSTRDLIPDRCEIRYDSSAPGGPFYCPGACDPDVDENGVPDSCGVDLKGVAMFLDCFTGEGGVVIAPGCMNLDRDHDGDLDLYDFATIRLIGPRQ